jgi:hypothetical protein
MDNIEEHCEDENLKALCQQCHNRYDIGHRRNGIRQRKHEAGAIGDMI